MFSTSAARTASGGSPAGRGRGAVALASALAVVGSASAETLVLASWGGPYADAQRAAFIDDFERETGIDVRMDEFSGGLGQVRAQVEVEDIHWDVVDLEIADVALGCEEGLLEHLDARDLPPAADGTAAEDDYIETAYSECGGGGIIYSTVVAYNAEAFPEDPPTTLADFFDIAKYPGQRGLRRTPMTNLELALQADGVAAADVYPTLETEAGKARAFRKLDQIKRHVLWWEASPQPAQMLADHEVEMTTSFNGRIFHEAVVEGQPFVTIWQGEVLEVSLFAIVAGTPRLAAAKRFLRFASRTESMAALARHLPFTPARRSAAKLAATHPTTGVDMLQHMPGSDEHLREAIRSDWRWWQDNLDELTERFTAWLLD